MTRLLSLLSLLGLARLPLVAKIALSLALVALIAVPVSLLATRDADVDQPFVAKSAPGYLFSIYDIQKPLGVAVDPSGQRIFVTESGGQHVTRVYNRDGEELMQLVPPETVASDRAPSYVAVDRLGTVYVSDRTRHTIDIYDVNGAHLGTFARRDDPGVAWAPLGLAFDSADNLYVTDVTDNKHRVMVFNSSGELMLEFGREGKGDGEFGFPNDLAVDTDGRIFVADSNNFRIQVFDAGGALLGGFMRGGGEAVGLPRGIEIRADHLYVVDTLGHVINVFNMAEGAALEYSFGAPGLGDGEFNFPNGLAVDSSGRVYVTDRENNRLQVWG